MPYLIALLLACSGGGSPTTSTPTVVPLPAPPPPRAVTPQELKDILADRPGHVRVLNFWATWCGPCVAELPMLRTAAQRHRDVELVLVNVDVPVLHENKVKPFIQAQGLEGITHVMLQSPNPGGELRSIVPGWQNEIPMTIVQKASGETVASFPRPIDGPTLDDAIAKAKAP